MLQKDASSSRCGESSWQAARNSLKKKKHLDETGLSIAGCRHGVAQRAVNMFYGEVYGYAHYIQVTDMVLRKVSFFWEDVVCKYWPWLEKKDPVVATKMKPALSVMHGKAHSWSCQVNRNMQHFNIFILTTLFVSYYLVINHRSIFEQSLHIHYERPLRTLITRDPLGSSILKIQHLMIRRVRILLIFSTSL